MKCFQCPGCVWIAEVSSETGIIVCPKCKTRTERKDHLLDCRSFAKLKHGTYGTHLHEILTNPPYSWFVGKDKEDCNSCKDIAARLNRYGNDWCEKNELKIMNMLIERAKDLKVPFKRTGLKNAMRKALKLARQDEKDFGKKNL